MIKDMVNKTYYLNQRRNAIVLFAGSLVLIAIMLFAVAQNTNLFSFASRNDRAMQFCLRKYSQEQCDKLFNRGNDNVPADITQWCNGKCTGSGLEQKVCKSVCVKVNTGSSCTATCRNLGNPIAVQRCTKQCPSLVKPTPTPTTDP